MLQIIPIPALNDNYIWLIANFRSGFAAVVDPGDAKPVLAALENFSLQLVAVLITHHHGDHCNGAIELQQHYNIPTYGPSEVQIPLSHTVKDGAVVTIDALNLCLNVLAFPGHTLGHIAYVNQDFLFCGDTLFAAGCGRLFEGTAAQMYSSLQKLAALPDNTLIYCGHEYTYSNLQFALAVEPDNRELQQRYQLVKKWVERKVPTLPSTMRLERLTNPFLRADKPNIKSAAEEFSQKSCHQPEEVFAVLRAWKDGFKANL